MSLEHTMHIGDLKYAKCTETDITKIMKDLAMFPLEGYNEEMVLDAIQAYNELEHEFGISLFTRSDNWAQELTEVHYGELMNLTQEEFERFMARFEEELKENEVEEHIISIMVEDHYNFMKLPNMFKSEWISVRY